MNTKPLTQFEPEAAKQLLSQIPFLSDLSLHDPSQFELLLQHSSIVELEPGEVIVTKGQIDKSFYFSLKGNLEVFAEETPGSKAIGQLSEGQVFGALSIINDQPRTATLRSPGDQKTLVFCADFTIFGELNDFTHIHLRTKISFLRIVINNTKWKLSVNKMNEPDHPLAKQLDKVSAFEGDKDSEDELEYLAEQAFLLGQILDEWNQQTTANIDVKEAPKKKKGLGGLLDKFKK